MENKAKWGAQEAVALALIITVTVLIVYSMFGFGVLKFKLWSNEFYSSYTRYMIVIPIIEVLVLIETVLFARYKHASLNDLGLKLTSSKTIFRVLAALMPLYLATAIVTYVLTNIFGHDPMAETFTLEAVPKDIFQLILYLIMYMVLVGPAEEFAFRGFIQKGFENTYGKNKGLLIASFLFGLPHIINYPYNAATATATGLVLGYVWQKTDQNTTATAILHGVFNSIGAILVYLGIIS
jgi:membrane protease YdiL (CAAX protease family)